VVIANELLDNLVFRIIERQPDGWAELFVKNGSEHLIALPALAIDLAGVPDPGLRSDHNPASSILDPDSEPPSDSDFASNLLESEPGSVAAELPPDPELISAIALAADIEVGQRVPVLSAASDWVNDVMARGAERLLVFDYGMATTTDLAKRGGWLRTYRDHNRGDDPFADPGEWDITTDLAVDQLPTPTLAITQAEWLTHWGIDALVEEGREYWQAHAAAPDLAAMRMRSRIREAEALTDPAGLGSWLALEYHR
jgi:SAM-dependent MidA family methyltransferase